MGGVHHGCLPSCLQRRGDICYSLDHHDPAVDMAEQGMTIIVGLSGSLRNSSINTSLLRHAAECAPDGVVVDICSIEGIPLYNGDIESNEGIPEAVVALKDKITEADGLLISTPEYNNSMPGVLKNTIDWLSRPVGDIARVFRAKPVAVIGATPGGFGTRLSQSAWLDVLKMLGTNPWFGSRLEISRAGQVFGEDNKITDEKVLEQVTGFIGGFAEFARQNS
jgi:NAD(P)H-dependent FMN reductase